METTVRITGKNELNIPVFKHLINDLLQHYGAVDITIRPQTKLNTEIINRMNAVDSGEEMVYFDNDEFEEFSKNIIKGIKPNLNNLKKAIKDEKGNIIPVNGI